MSLLLLNALLILVGPFLVVAPFALAAARSLAPATRWRCPRPIVPHVRLAVGW